MRVTQPPLRLKADLGLVLVRGSDRSGFQDEREGWIMTVKLTDAQFAMLSAAARRGDHCLTAPEKPKGAILAKVGDKLVKLGLVRQVQAKAGMPVWRRDDAGSFALKLTAAGLKTIAVEDGSDEAAAGRAALLPRRDRDASNASVPDSTGQHAKTTPREGSKLAQVIDLLERPDGATIPHLTRATGWLPHTTRAALTGLRKRGYAVARERVDGGDSVYRIAGVVGDGAERFIAHAAAPEGHDREIKPKASRAA
jgi:hypothetical protein